MRLRRIAVCICFATNLMDDFVTEGETAKCLGLSRLDKSGFLKTVMDFLCNFKVIRVSHSIDQQCPIYVAIHRASAPAQRAKHDE